MSCTAHAPPIVSDAVIYPGETCQRHPRRCNDLDINVGCGSDVSVTAHVQSDNGKSQRERESAGVEQTGEVRDQFVRPQHT